MTQPSRLESEQGHHTLERKTFLGEEDTESFFCLRACCLPLFFLGL
ncbi:unnamed protein product, partial [Ectocarpus sp. 12 AP-2014]